MIVPLSFILLNNLNYSNSFGISDPSFNVKIIHPYKNDTLSKKENILVKGIANYNSSQDCSISVIVNNKKPYILVTPKGNNGTSDFSQWEYVIDKNSTKHKLIDGVNKITAKNYCLNSLSTAFYSVFFNLSSTMGSFKHNDTGDTMVAFVNATAAAPSNATAAAPSNATAAAPSNATAAAPSNATAAAPPKATSTNVICCKNLFEGKGKDTPTTLQGMPVQPVSTDDGDGEKSHFEGKDTEESFAEKIRINIDYLYSLDSYNQDSFILNNHDGAQDRHVDENENDESGLKDVGNYNIEGDGLQDIKNTIENALS